MPASKNKPRCPQRHGSLFLGGGLAPPHAVTQLWAPRSPRPGPLSLAGSSTPPGRPRPPRARGPAGRTCRPYPHGSPPPPWPGPEPSPWRRGAQRPGGRSPPSARSAATAASPCPQRRAKATERSTEVTPGACGSGRHEHRRPGRETWTSPRNLPFHNVPYFFFFLINSPPSNCRDFSISALESERTCYPKYRRSEAAKIFSVILNETRFKYSCVF